MKKPVSTATNAYDLLSDICRIITEEPRRIRMETWITHMHEIDDKKMRPPCGTAGCVGGWVETLTDSINIEWILGVTHRQGAELFYPSRLLAADNQGTPEHARAVVRHIKKFQKKYSRRLKSREVECVTKPSRIVP